MLEIYPKAIYLGGYIKLRRNIRMIFITLGSQKFQFNRLLKAVDDLVEIGELSDEVFARLVIVIINRVTTSLTIS